MIVFMSITEPESMDTQVVSQVVRLDSIRDWLIQTTHLFTKFAITLTVLGSALVLSFTFNLPLYISYSIVLIIAAVLFIMLIMVSIKNIVYLYLKTSVWGQIVLYLLVALFSARSYLWAIGEINRIFLVDSSNLSITTTVLTATQFFKYAIMILLGSYLVAIGLYAYLKLKETKKYKTTKTGATAEPNQENASSPRKITSKLLAGATFVLVVILSIITISNISKYSDTMIQSFAVKIDFYSYYTCTGKDFEDIDGVLFLSASDILVAKETGPMKWQFKKVKCEP